MRNETRACLLVHGYAGRPFEMRFLEERLRQAGFLTAVPILAGHDGDEAGFSASRFVDWRGSVNDAFEDLRCRADRIFVVGFSLGGSLALDLAQSHAVDGLVTISAPVFLCRLYPYWAPDWRLFATGIMRHVCPSMPMPPARQESRALAPWQGYEAVQYLDVLHSLRKGVEDVGRGLHRVTAPILILHALQDQSVHVDNAWCIAKSVRSTHREVRLLSLEETITTRHMLTTHLETRDVVANAVCAFLGSL